MHSSVGRMTFISMYIIEEAMGICDFYVSILCVLSCVLGIYLLCASIHSALRASVDRHFLRYIVAV